LVALDLCEVGLREHEPGAVQAAVVQSLGHHLVDRAVVDDRAGPGDAADDADRLHAVIVADAGVLIPLLARSVR
jgi:hypothetical protein